MKSRREATLPVGLVGRQETSQQSDFEVNVVRDIRVPSLKILSEANSLTSFDWTRSLALNVEQLHLYACPGPNAFDNNAGETSVVLIGGGGPHNGALDWAEDLLSRLRDKVHSLVRSSSATRSEVAMPPRIPTSHPSCAGDWLKLLHRASFG